jgi:hypothetical protein
LFKRLLRLMGAGRTKQPHSYVVGDPRPLRSAEHALLEVMLRTRNSTSVLLQELDGLLVQDMNDGGMGSLRVWRGSDEQQRFGSVAAEAQFNDADGMLVLASINLDSMGRLFELDLFKGDFSPLKQIPASDQVRFDPLRDASRPAPDSGGRCRPR